MIEISIHRNYNCVFNNSKKSKNIELKSLVAPTALTIIGSESYKNMANFESFDNIKDDLKAIADFCTSVTTFIKDICWCLSNPFHALVIFLDYISPFMIGFATITPIIGIMCYMMGSNKFFKWKTNELVTTPLMVYLIYLTLNTVLKAILFL